MGRPRRPAAAGGLGRAHRRTRRGRHQGVRPGHGHRGDGVGRGCRVPVRPGLRRLGRSSGRTTATATRTSTPARFDRATGQPTGEAFPICTRFRSTRRTRPSTATPSSGRTRATAAGTSTPTTSPTGASTRSARRRATRRIPTSAATSWCGRTAAAASGTSTAYDLAKARGVADLPRSRGAQTRPGRLERPHRLAGCQRALRCSVNDQPVQRYVSPHVYAVQRGREARSWARSGAACTTTARRSPDRERSHRGVRGHRQAGRGRDAHLRRARCSELWAYGYSISPDDVVREHAGPDLRHPGGRLPDAAGRRGRRSASARTGWWQGELDCVAAVRPAGQGAAAGRRRPQVLGRCRSRTAPADTRRVERQRRGARHAWPARAGRRTP